MDGVAEESLNRQSIVSLLRFIAIRAFPKFENWQDDRQDKVIKAFAKYADVPVINGNHHPSMPRTGTAKLAIYQHLGKPQKKKVYADLTYHPKPLNTAVANSSLLIASKFGIVTLLALTSNIFSTTDTSIWPSKMRKRMAVVSVTHDIDHL